MIWGSHPSLIHLLPRCEHRRRKWVRLPLNVCLGFSKIIPRTRSLSCRRRSYSAVPVDVHHEHEIRCKGGEAPSEFFLLTFKCCTLTVNSNTLVLRRNLTMKKILYVLSLLIIASMILTACGTAAATEAPAATGAPVDEPVATEAPAEE